MLKHQKRTLKLCELNAHLHKFFTIFFAVLLVLTAHETARAQHAGRLDANFNVTGKVVTNIAALDGANALAVQKDNKIVVAGRSEDATQIPQFALVRYTAAGALDTTFDADGWTTLPVGATGGYANALAIQTDGKIVAAGQSRRDLQGSPVWDFTLVRYNDDGSLDASFGAEGKVITDFGTDSFARSVALQADGKIVVAGSTAPDTIYPKSISRSHGSPQMSPCRVRCLISTATREPTFRFIVSRPANGLSCEAKTRRFIRRLSDLRAIFRWRRITTATANPI